MRRHLTSPRVQPPPTVPSRQQRHWRITLALAILTGICIGVSLRSIREDKAAREKAVEAPEAVLRGADPGQSERARYTTFEENMGLRKQGDSIRFVW